LDAVLRVACVEVVGGAANCPVDPEGANLLAVGRTEIGARVETLEDGIKRGVAANVVEKPRVLDFNGDGKFGAMEEIEIVDALEVSAGVRRVADGDVEAGDSLYPFDVGFKLKADFRRDLRKFSQCFGVAIGGDERKDEALPGVGSEGVGRGEGDVGCVGGLEGGVDLVSGTGEGE
jgi:hypothetical protein